MKNKRISSPRKWLARNESDQSSDGVGMGSVEDSGATRRDENHAGEGLLEPTHDRIADFEGHSDGLFPIVLGPPTRDLRDEQPLPGEVAASTALLSCVGGGAWVGGAYQLDDVAVQVRAAAVRGWKKGGRPHGQDAAFVAGDGRRVVLAVADGVGSMPKSHLVAAWALEGLGKSFPRTAELGAQEAVVTLFDAAKQHIDDCASGPLDRVGGATLVVALIEQHTDPSGQRATSYVVGAVGDSACLLIEDKSWWHILGEKNPDEPMATRSLPRHALGGASGMKTGTCPRGSVLVLATDGLHEAIGDGNSPLGAHLVGTWASPPRPLEFANDIDYRLAGYFDDRAAVAVWL